MHRTQFHNKDLSEFSFLVTGGAGFIGSNLVEYLLKNGAGKVRVLDNLATGFRINLRDFEENQRFEFIEGDITNLQTCMHACKGIDFVSHQAALGSVPRSVSNPVGTNNANVNGFLNMLVAARDSGAKRMVFASSSSVYGDSPMLPKKENNIGKPLSPYAVSKLVNELYADVFHKTYGQELIGLRYFNIFGPHQNPEGEYAAAIPLFIKAILNGDPFYINGDGNQTRDFTFVENAVQANIKAFFTPKETASGNIYNIAVGERISLNQLVEILEELTGKKANKKYREERKGDVKDSLADISLAEDFLGYEPQVHIREGLKSTLEWFNL